ncbi:MAG TPA: TIGR03086 family metal-binding protein [Propionibacteriaceae bacterium]
MTPDQNPADEYRELAGHFTALVEGVHGDTGWEQPAPPAGWTARDVVRHLVEWFPSFLLQGSGITLPIGPDVDEDPVGAWRTFTAGVQAVLDDPATEGKLFSNPHTGDLPLPQAISQFFTADVFMHSWDLARATGQDETLDPERCAMMVAGMESFDEVLRSSGQYGPRVEVPDDADPQTRLLAFIGRDPR